MRLLMTAILAAGLGVAPLAAQTRATSGDGKVEVRLAGQGLTLHDPDSGALLDQFTIDKQATAVEISEDGSAIYIAFTDGSIEGRSRSDLALLWRSPIFEAPVSKLQRSETDLLAFAENGNATILLTATGEEAPEAQTDETLRLGSRIVAADLNQDRLLFTLNSGRIAYFDRKARVWLGDGIKRDIVAGAANAPAVKQPASIETGNVTVGSDSIGLKTAMTEGTGSFAGWNGTVNYATANAVVAYQDQLVSVEPQMIVEPAPQIEPAPASAERGFPWPPPEPSAQDDVDGWTLGAEICRWKNAQAAGQPALRDADCTPGQEQVTFRHVDWLIREALKQGNYEATKYHPIPGGFAAVTRVESIDRNGVPLQPGRWSHGAPQAAEDAREGFLGRLISALTTAPRGYYRFIGFALNDTLRYDEREEPVTLAEAQDWLAGGAADLYSLDPALASTPLEPFRHKLRILVYVFEKPNKVDDAVQINVNASDHLRYARIVSAPVSGGER